MSEITGREQGSPYDSAAVLGAALAMVFFPVISLIAALLLQGNQPDPVKKKQLRTWALLSAGWLAVQAIIFVIAVIAFTSAAHPVGPQFP